MLSIDRACAGCHSCGQAPPEPSEVRRASPHVAVPLDGTASIILSCSLWIVASTWRMPVCGAETTRTERASSRCDPCVWIATGMTERSRATQQASRWSSGRAPRLERGGFLGSGRQRCSATAAIVRRCSSGDSLHGRVIRTLRPSRRSATARSSRLRAGDSAAGDRDRSSDGPTGSGTARRVLHLCRGKILEGRRRIPDFFGAVLHRQRGELGGVIGPQQPLAPLRQPARSGREVAPSWNVPGRSPGS